MNKALGEDIIGDYLTRINNVIEGSGYVVSIKILHPTDISLTTLTPLQVLSEISLKEKYKMMEDIFVDLGGNFYSLTFQKYSEAVKYSPIDRPVAFNHKKQLKYPDLFKDPLVNLDLDENDLNRLKDKANLEPYWERWVAHIKNYFPVGRSTSWSYAILRRSGKEIISSAFLIFSEEIGMEKAIIINKLCQDLLYEIIMELYAVELKRSEFEKVQLAREQMLYVGMGHYIKNSMKGLEEHEIEIINYLKGKCPDNDKIVIIAQLQRLIYSLIELYLQMRQIAVSGTLPTEIINRKVKIKLYDFINLIYLHVIIARGRFYMALENKELFQIVKNTVIKQIGNISELTNVLRNDSFNQNEINKVLSDTSEIEHFHYLSKSGFSYIIKVDDSIKQLELDLNSIQLKYLYTVFTEILDNCFSNKHSSGSRVAYLYLGVNGIENYKNIVISSRDSSQKLDEKFKFGADDLCDNCLSNGNGIKIIQSALSNEYLESKLFFPINSESIRKDISERRSIKIYEYNLHLNNKLFV